MNGGPASAITVLDLGTARTTLLHVSLADGLMRYAGHVSVASQGMRKGAVVSLPAAAERVRAAAAALEQRTGAAVERVVMSLTAAQARGVTSQAGMALTSRSREITREDAHRVLDLARSITLPEDRQILHVVPQEFVLDRQGGVQEPVGMLASRLEARIYAITVAAAAKDNRVLAANQAGLEVEEIVFAPLAAAEACLSAEERYAGVALLDLGAGSTGVLLYAQGALAHAGVVPIGGDHFTNDIAAGLGTPAAAAEGIKCDYGAVAASFAGETSAIELPGVGDLPARSISRRRLCECIEARARELVQMIQAEVSRAGALGAGLVVTGGAWRLQGLREMLAESTGMPVRVAQPAPIEGMPALLAEPEFAFACGACYYAHRILARQTRPPTVWEKLRARFAALSD
jgi:cell division protein FtsA